MYGKSQMMRRWTALLLALWLIPPTEAAAQAASVVWKGGDAENEVRGKVVRAIEEQLASKGHQIRRTKLACEADDDACIRRALLDAGVTVGVRMSVWRPNRFRRTGQVHVTLLDPAEPLPFGEVRGEKECGEANCDVSAQQLVSELLDLWSERKGTLVRIETVPAGAVVFQGPELLGVAPLEHRFTRGKHHLRVTAQGYAPKDVEVIAGPTQEASLLVRLKRGGETVATTPQEPSKPRRKRSAKKRRKALAVVSGALLMAAGIGLMAAGSVGLSRKDGCLEGIPCTAERRRNSAPGAYLGVGSGLFGGGVGLMVVGLKKGGD